MTARTAQGLTKLDKRSAQWYTAAMSQSKREVGIIRELRGWVSGNGAPCVSLMIELCGTYSGQSSKFRQAFGPFCGEAARDLFMAKLKKVGITPSEANGKECFILRAFPDGSIIDGIEVLGTRITWMEIARALTPPGESFKGPYETRRETLSDRLARLESEIADVKKKLDSIDQDYTNWEDGCERQGT